MEVEKAIRDHAPAKAAGRRPTPPTRFTALELAAAEQLLHLSESSCSSGAAFTPRGSGTAASGAYSSSSPRSVNTPPAATARDLVGADHEEEDDEQEVGGRPRMNRRYRSIAELYDAMDPSGARRRKGKAVAGGPREGRRK